MEYTYAITAAGYEGGFDTTELVNFIDHRLSDSDRTVLSQELEAARQLGEDNGWNTADVIKAALATFGERTGIIGLLVRGQIIQEIKF